MNKCLMMMMMLICALFSSVIATSAMAQEGEYVEVAANEAVAANDGAGSDAYDYNGFQIRLHLGADIGDLSRWELDYNGNEDEYYYTDYAGGNWGLELGYVWDSFGVYVHTEMSTLVQHHRNELHAKSVWSKAELEAVFRGYFSPKPNIRPYIGVGIGAVFYEKYNSECDSLYDVRDVIVSLEGGVDWLVTTHLLLGFRVNLALSGIFGGYTGIRPSLTLGYTF